MLLTTNKLTPEPYLRLSVSDYIPKPSHVDLFDQNGYDLTFLEQQFVEANDLMFLSHRPHRQAIKYEWFTEEQKTEGAHINHALLFERKGYEDEALNQLMKWSKYMPLFYKVAKIRPKWGIDFSVDYCDKQGNVFEVLHYEYDGFEYNEIIERKEEYEQLFLEIDWDYAAKQLLKRKDEWFNLSFFEQSDYKCNFFNIDKERFKMVIWD